jgi:citrate lyase subunit beta/citryl-CoA lyase
MSAVVRPRRSVLFMPGSNARALEKAKTLAADALIFDLEDAVAPDAKAVARQQVHDTVCAGGYGQRELIVRVNALTTPWGRDDLTAVAACGPDAVLAPKVESADSVRQMLTLLAEQGAPETLDVWCMLETPFGILRAEEIAAASPRGKAFVMGTSDLTKDLHAQHTRDRLPLLHSLAHCLLVGRAYGLTVLDGVHLDLSDDEGFAAVCQQAAEMGFDGKTLIHPKTIDAANAAFAPSVEEVEWSRRVIAAHTEATTQGQGAVLVDGQLIENLHVENAQRIVRIAEAIRAMASA